MRDPRARHRGLLQAALSGAARDLEPGSGQLVREQLGAAEPASYEPAALACLAAAEAAGGPAEAALPGAVAIVFVAQMGLVFSGLENSGGAASLSTAWGMPRSLNAGDAMFALAQETVLAAPNELTADDRVAAASLLDGGARDLVEALHALAPDADGAAAGQRALLPAALALGGLLAGASAHKRERLAELGRAWSALPEEELSRKLADDPAGWLAT